MTSIASFVNPDAERLKPARCPPPIGRLVFVIAASGLTLKRIGYAAINFAPGHEWIRLRHNGANMPRPVGGDALGAHHHHLSVVGGNLRFIGIEGSRPSEIRSEIAQPVVQRIRIEFRYRIPVQNRNLVSSRQFDDGPLRPPDSRDVRPAKVAVVIRINVAVGGRPLAQVSNAVIASWGRTKLCN